MPLRPLTFREVNRRLEAANFTQVHQRGSHVKFGKQTALGFRTASIPNHLEIAVGTIRSILRQAGISADEFENL